MYLVLCLTFFLFQFILYWTIHYLCLLKRRKETILKSFSNRFRINFKNLPAFLRFTNRKHFMGIFLFFFISLADLLFQSAMKTWPRFCQNMLSHLLNFLLYVILITIEGRATFLLYVASLFLFVSNCLCFHYLT